MTSTQKRLFEKIRRSSVEDSKSLTGSFNLGIAEEEYRKYVVGQNRRIRRLQEAVRTSNLKLAEYMLRLRSIDDIKR